MEVLWFAVEAIILGIEGFCCRLIYLAFFCVGEVKEATVGFGGSKSKSGHCFKKKK